MRFNNFETYWEKENRINYQYGRTAGILIGTLFGIVYGIALTISIYIIVNWK